MQHQWGCPEPVYTEIKFFTSSRWLPTTTGKCVYELKFLEFGEWYIQLHSALLHLFSSSCSKTWKEKKAVWYLEMKKSLEWEALNNSYGFLQEKNATLFKIIKTYFHVCWHSISSHTQGKMVWFVHQEKDMQNPLFFIRKNHYRLVANSYHNQATFQISDTCASSVLNFHWFNHLLFSQFSLQTICTLPTSVSMCKNVGHSLQEVFEVAFCFYQYYNILTASKLNKYTLNTVSYWLKFSSPINQLISLIKIDNP